MGKNTGFMEYERQKGREESPTKRIRNFNEYTERLTDDVLSIQGARCMDCGTPFCQMGVEVRGMAAGCPIHNLMPEWNDLVYKGQWKEALERLQLTNNFPEFTGRVCPAPCEGACTVAINDPAVAIKSIERAIIDRGFEEGWVQPRIPSARTGYRVAIVGSGPAGLAAADQLNQMGHDVTVFERDDRAGGLLMYGIPNMKLDKHVVQRRVDLLMEEGVTFQLNTEIGRTITKTQLQQQFDAVILCVGAQVARELHLEGSASTGVIKAMDYLTKATKSLLANEFAPIDVKGKDVIVIGGGDTGADCVATALRQGAKSVHQFGKHPQLPTTRQEDQPWPIDPNVYKLDYAYEEAVAKFGEDPREYCIQTKKMIAHPDGRLKELHTIQMEKIVTEEGYVYFQELEGTERVWPADYVFVAIGFEGMEEGLGEHFQVRVLNHRIYTAEKYETSEEGVFTAGDARRGPSLIVWAIREGREVAEVVHGFLKKRQAIAVR